MKDKKKGLYGKYRIEKGDGSPVDPKAIYFTMRLDTDPFARVAARAYVEACREEQPELARDLERVIRQFDEEWQAPKLTKVECEGTELDYSGWYADGFGGQCPS